MEGGRKWENLLWRFGSEFGEGKKGEERECINSQIFWYTTPKQKWNGILNLAGYYTQPRWIDAKFPSAEDKEKTG